MTSFEHRSSRPDKEYETAAAYNKAVEIRSGLINDYIRRAMADNKGYDRMDSTAEGRPLRVEIAWGEIVADTKSCKIAFGTLPMGEEMREYAASFTLTSKAEGPGLFYQQVYTFDQYNRDDFQRREEQIFSLDKDNQRVILQSRVTTEIPAAEIDELLVLLKEQ